MRRAEPLPSIEELHDLMRPHGVTQIGVAPATVLDRARRALHERKSAGLHGEMNFTYRNPERSTDPSRALPGARSVIVAARPYLAEEDPPAPQGIHGRVARYAWADHYGVLREGLRAVASRLKRSGERAVAFADDNSLVDREVAYLAGLGWFGKNANLLVPGAGSFFVLGSVITTAAYPVSEPVPDGCGTCRKCIDGCPTGAIVAPGVIDANRCLAWLVQRPGAFPVEYREALGDRLYGCDDCQDSCPITVRLGHRHRSPVGSAPQAWVDVLELLEASDDEVLERVGRWYIADRDPRWIRRNALIVLGNTGDPQDARVRAVAQRYAEGGDEILAEHARWALARIGREVPAAIGARR